MSTARSLGVAVLLAVGGLGACELADVAPQPPSQHPQVMFRTAERGEVRVVLEIAATPQERSRGLMHRRELPSNAGMVFVFPEAATQQFWMENTPIPLDIVFIDADNRVVGVVADAEPMTRTTRSVDAPAKYVVELNGGFAARHGITAGTEVTWAGVPREALR